ncbi:MAG: hypothetical protein LBN27_01710 [Prevotellaceae bacterium]|jgi:hypothetical protein|nr:hypothetical protein [Prevotellaceae bacterium]
MDTQVIIEIKDGENIAAEAKFKRPDAAALSAVNKLQKTDEVRAIDMFFSQCCTECPDWVKQDALLKIRIGGAALQKMSKQFTVSVKN